MEAKINKNSPYRLAMRDISEDIRLQNLTIIDDNFDVWVVCPSRVFTKESRKLNAELGLHKINKFGHRYVRKRKQK